MVEPPVVAPRRHRWVSLLQEKRRSTAHCRCPPTLPTYALTGRRPRRMDVRVGSPCARRLPLACEPAASCEDSRER